MLEENLLSVVTMIIIWFDVFNEILYFSPPCPENREEPPPVQKLLVSSNFNLSDRAETLRFDATGELSNLPKYESDPRCQSGVPGLKP